MPVAMATPASPKIRTANTVAIAEARMLTKLLPMSQDVDEIIANENEANEAVWSLKQCKDAGGGF